MTFTDGSTYEGGYGGRQAQWRRHAALCRRLPLVGEWKQDRRIGHGVYTSADGKAWI
jgi:hypothetical protein